MINYLLNGLTIKQSRIMAFIESFIGSNGFAPSLREIGESFHIAPSSALDHLRRLEKKGFIRRSALKPRCVKVVRSLGSNNADSNGS